MQALYEAVFAMSALDRPFRLYTRVGHVAVNPAAPLSEWLKVSSVFVVEDDEDGDDLLQFLATHVTYYIDILAFTWHYQNLYTL